MPIHILSDQIASQIAAGEVVERPSSVVKELLENAIDAGAEDIRVEIRAGGKRFIRVTDDGCGIPASDAALAFERHSTSKLSTVEDLDHISTLGFRGEALASIAAVSRVTMVTRAADEEVGTLLQLEGGELVEQRPTGRSSGTTVTVEDLFFNVPARRKFLRTDLTERRHVSAWVTRYALAYPNLRLTLVDEGRETFRSPGKGQLRDVLVTIHGPDVAAELLQVFPQAGQARPIEVSGFVSPPAIHRGSRQGIVLFVNGRWVNDRQLTYAVIQAYHTFLPKGRYPLAVVKVRMPSEDVDVNVHPTKVEVRFRDGDAVFRSVQRAVRQTVMSEAPVAPGGTHPAATWSAPSSWSGAQRPRPWNEASSSSSETLIQPAMGRDERQTQLPPLRLVGQVSATYVVTEGPDGLYLIDQHAAHERVLYEEMMAQGERERPVASQGLLEPATVELPPESAAVVEENLETLRHLGVDVELFGGNVFLVRSMPAILAQARPSEVLADVAESLEETQSRVEQEVEEAIVRGICKRAAVKAGQVLTREEMEALIRGLERCDSPRTCPHGRPTMIRLTVDQLARQFGRG
jgi:DNA mismatch repair protein MutL